MITNFAYRAHNHTWGLDPIVRSLLDTDWYKLAILQFIWRHYRDVKVEFSLINRNKTVRLGDQIDEVELRRQLDYVKHLQFRKNELIYLKGNTYQGISDFFCPEFIQFLSEYRMKEYDLRNVDGQWELTFGGDWVDSSMWEIYALSIINELRTRWALSKMSEFEMDVLYSRAKTKLWEKIERIRGVPGLKIADFGTRRRHSFLWQDYVVGVMASELPDIFTGTSNVYLAMKHGLEAIGTNAHELPMVTAVLAENGLLGDVDLKNSQYEVFRQWREDYGQAMSIFLPDTFGTTQFLRDAPEWMSEVKGGRLDSKNPFVGCQELIDFFQSRGADPLEKLCIFSDGLDVDPILELHAQFAGDIQTGYLVTDFQSGKDFHNTDKWTYKPNIRTSNGWGTLLTNDFRGCHPRGLDDFNPLSLVCKVKTVNGFPAVKLSDNYTKATGPSEVVERYRRVFGIAGLENIPVVV